MNHPSEERSAPAKAAAAPKTSRLAQVSILLTPIVGGQFLFLAGRAAEEWHGDADWQSLITPAACCVGSALVAIICGVVAAVQILHHRNRLKGLGWCVAAVALCSLFTVWVVSGVKDVARQKALKAPRHGSAAPAAYAALRANEAAAEVETIPPVLSLPIRVIRVIRG